MRNTMVSIILAVLVMSLLTLSVWASPLPDELPTDMDAGQLYWYMIELNDTYLKKGVFTDASSFTEEDRENARRAATLIIEAVTKEVEESGTADQYMIWIRGCAYEALFIDTNDPAYRLKALDDYAEAIERGSVFAETDYDRVEAMETSTPALDWQIPHMLTLNEASALLDAKPLSFVALPNRDDDPNQLGVGYALQAANDPAATTIYVLIDLQGGVSLYNALKNAAFIHEPTEIDDLADAAFSLGLRNSFRDPMLYRTVVAMKGDMVIQVRVPDREWRRLDLGFDPEHVALDFAVKLLDNIADTERELPSLDGVVVEDLKPLVAMPVPEGDTSLPDELPEDTGYRTPRGYVIDLHTDYVPYDIFSSAAYDALARDDARQAMRIIERWATADMLTNGPDQYNLELRAYCYYMAHLDTDSPVFWHLALNDYKQLYNDGYTYVGGDYRLLAHPILSKMKEGLDDEDELYIVILQDWLIDAGFLMEPVTDEATTEAIRACQEAFSLPVDGRVDFDFLLMLYAHIDDNDWLIYGD